MQPVGKVLEVGDLLREERIIQKQRTGWDYEVGHRPTLTMWAGERLGHQGAHCFCSGVWSLLTPRQTISLCWLSLSEQPRAIVAQV